LFILLFGHPGKETNGNATAGELDVEEEERNSRLLTPDYGEKEETEMPLTPDIQRVEFLKRDHKKGEAELRRENRRGETKEKDDNSDSDSKTTTTSTSPTHASRSSTKKQKKQQIVLQPNENGDFVVPVLRTGMSINSERKGVRQNRILIKGVQKRSMVEIVDSERLPNPTEMIDIWFASSWERRMVSVDENIVLGEDEALLLVEAPKITRNIERTERSTLTIKLYRQSDNSPFFLMLVLVPGWRQGMPRYFIDARKHHIHNNYGENQADNQTILPPRAPIPESYDDLWFDPYQTHNWLQAHLNGLSNETSIK